MSLRLAAAAATVTLVMTGITPAFAVEAAGEDDSPCGGRAPLREVAQDEVYTFAERCGLENLARTDRGPTDAGAVGWAKARDGAPMPNR